MKRDKIEANGLDAFIANISPMLDGLNTQMATMAQLLGACHDPIKDDAELQARMALIDELYSHADSEGHAAARFAEMVADRVYEYERESVLVPFATQSAVSEILNNKRKMTVAQIKGFAEFFSVPVEFFMHGVV